MNIIDIIGYILKHYPQEKELAKGRLNKLIYLADWKSSLDYGKQITTIKWIFNHYGPYVNDIETNIEFDNRISIKNEKNDYGNDKYLVILDKDKDFIEPNDNEKKTLDLVINITHELNWNKFINAVYSTYPIKVSERGSELDLPKLAEEYKTS